MLLSYMDFHYAQTEAFSLAVSTKTIYYMHVDDSYKVAHAPLNNHYVLLLTLSGQGNLDVDGKHYVLNTGDYFIFNTEQTFYYETSSKHWHFWWFEFQPDQQTENYTTSMQPHTIQLDEYLDFLCKEALHALKLNEQTISSSLLGSLICLLESKKKKQLLSQQNMDLFQKADSYFRESLSTATVTECAKLLGTSETTLRETFLQLLGYGPGSYLLQLKVDQAKYLLNTEHYSILDISEKLGYSDQFSFSKRFKIETGMSPTRYRQRYINQAR